MVAVSLKNGSVFVRLKPAVTSGPGVRHCAETQPPCSLITSGREQHRCAALDRLIAPVRLHCPVFFKQKTAYEIMGGDWSSDVCSSD
eukprot:SAG22_NODE_17240_length_309_cov_0.514286_1_plen_86_part_01